MEANRVPVEKLRWTCNPDQFDFEHTQVLVPLQDFIGQDRAVKAIEFGLSIRRPGYNIFVTGLTGTGKMSAIKSYLQKTVEARGAMFTDDQPDDQPDDWCYVQSFSDPDRPQALSLPRGKGKVLRAQIRDLLGILKSEIAKAFSAEEYQAQNKQVLEEGQRRQQEIFQTLEREAAQEGFVLQISQMGVALVPIVQGKPASQNDFLALPEEIRSNIEERRSNFMQKVEEAFHRAHLLEKETAQRIKELDEKVGEFTIARPFEALKSVYRDHPAVQAYLDDLRKFTLQSIERFRQQEGQRPPVESLNLEAVKERDAFLAFEVNVFVDNSGTAGPPIVIESNPTYGNVFGKMERRAFMGAYFTDHTMIKPGALSLANGGYLVLNARDALTSPGVWEGLKRVIRNKELRLEDPLDQLTFVAPAGLRPQPMPIDVKVIMVGDSKTYDLLSAYDEDFWEIFKVKADFNFEIDRTAANVGAYAAFICGCCESEGLKHFDRSGVAAIVEHGSRLVEDQTRLSSRFGQLKDLLIEADYWAGKDGSSTVKAEHVRKAIAEKLYRSNLAEERLQDMIADGTIMVDVEGAVVGQVNGLAVYSLGDISFGKPSRITAKTFMGRGGVINIEREAQLSGKTHDKGILILGGYLGYKYAQDRPLSVSASLCFEQSYSGVDGDSASSTELYAILSSLSGIPIKQSFAVTGSVNQHGEIQPIGGVNFKIEGFFDVCKAKGLTGEQGVIVPHQNVRNLMLREDVVEAVAQGKFRIFSVKTIDEGIELLMGVKAGVRGEDGQYPEGTVNYAVDRRLRELAEGIKDFHSNGKAKVEQGAR
ncbi:MAG: AAA family ATPase [Chloroflexi bacterium]|nr:AAA family ATPase [Chloroflexota bacterium]